MQEKYKRWIEENVPDNPRGMCWEMANEMTHVFPELKLVRGIYHCFYWGKQAHWWTVDSEGIIVDPTMDQFPSVGLGSYQEIDRGNSAVARCSDCGDVFVAEAIRYGTISFCNEKCEQNFVNSLEWENDHAGS